MSGAQRRATEKELASVDRQLARLADRIAAKHTELADHDQSDHVGVTGLTSELRSLEDEVAADGEPLAGIIGGPGMRTGVLPARRSYCSRRIGAVAR